MHAVGIQETAKGITVKRTHDGGVESQFHSLQGHGLQGNAQVNVHPAVFLDGGTYDYICRRLGTRRRQLFLRQGCAETYHRTDGPGLFGVGNRAETQNLLENARKKLGRKNASLVVANDVTRAGAGFGTDTNVAAFVTAQGVRELPMMTKRELADKILDEYVSGKNS